MELNSRDREFLNRAADLAEAALEAGDEPFGSVLVAADGTVLFEDRNRADSVDALHHPEFTIVQWALRNSTPENRAAAVVYTSGEHRPMCSAAHAWAGLGRIVYAMSARQLAQLSAELGTAASPVAPIPIATVAPEIETSGPDPALENRMRELHIQAQRGR